MKIFIITALLVISYVAASPMLAEDEEFDGLVDRVARATQKQRKKEAKDHWKNSCNSKGRAIQSSDVKCPKGKKAEMERDDNGDMVALRCVSCEDGKYTHTKGLFESCCDCPAGKTTVGGKVAECVELCPPGKGRGNNGKCALCDDDMYNDGDSLECKPCPDFHKVKKSEMKKAQKAATKSECKLEKCPDGFIKTPDDSCKPCGHGNFSNLDGDQCKSCAKEKPFTLSNANKGAKACFALNDNAEKDCYDYMFKTLKVYGPKMKEEKKEKDEKMEEEDEEDPDEGGRLTGDSGVTGSDDGSRPTGDGGGPPAKRKKRAVAKDEEKTTEGKPEKGKRAQAKEEKEKKEKQARGKSLRSAICKGKGSLDELRANYRACKALEESTGKKLMPEFAKLKDAKKVSVKDILEKEVGDATCDDVDEDDKCEARTGSGRQSGSGSGHSGSGSGHSGSGSGHSGSGSGHSGSGSGHSGSGSGHSGSGSGTPPPPPPPGGETGDTKPGSGGPLRR